MGRKYVSKLATKQMANKKNTLIAIGAAVVIVLAGAIYIFMARAATTAASVEAENGTKSGNAVVDNDANASAGKYVTFRAAGSSGCGATAPNGIAGNWKTIFCDEFEGAALDTTKWHMCNASFTNQRNVNGVNYVDQNLCRTTYNDELQFFRTNLTNNPNVFLSNGKLVLRATRENGRIYSGMVSTAPNNKHGYNLPGYNPMLFKFGIVEWKAKFPGSKWVNGGWDGSGDGFWPSFWMLPDQVGLNKNWPQSGEFDIVEIPGNRPSEVHTTVHTGVCSGGCPAQNGNGKTGYLNPDAAAEYHTYALEWTEKSLTWYIDGKHFFTAANFNKMNPNDGAYINHPFYIIANFSLGSAASWGGQLGGGVDGSTKFPADFNIEYVRVFQRQ